MGVIIGTLAILYLLWKKCALEFMKATANQKLMKAGQIQEKIHQEEGVWTLKLIIKISGITSLLNVMELQSLRHLPKKNSMILERILHRYSEKKNNIWAKFSIVLLEIIFYLKKQVVLNKF